MSNVKAGEVYRSKAKKGWRHVVVNQVRASHPPAYVLASECTRSGRRIHGAWSDMPIRIALTHVDGAATMPPWYERVVVFR